MVLANTRPITLLDREIPDVGLHLQLEDRKSLGMCDGPGCLDSFRGGIS